MTAITFRVTLGTTGQVLQCVDCGWYVPLYDQDEIPGWEAAHVAARHRDRTPTEQEGTK